MKSIRNHLTALLLLSLGLVCIIGGLLGSHVIRKVILREFDYSLRTKVHDLSTLTEWEDDQYKFEFVEKRMPEFERREHPEYYQICLPNSVMLDHSFSLGKGSLSLPDGPLSEEPKIYDLILPGGLPGRAAAITFLPIWGDETPEPADHDREPITIIIARDTVRLNRVFHKIVAGFLVGITSVLLIVFLTVKWIIQRGLHPLDSLAEQVLSIHPETLDIRLPTTSIPTELRPIVEQLNRLLERIDSAFQRERYLTTGMAHELYTPIAELRSMTEVALKWPDDPESTAEVVAAAHDIALQMQSLVSALLSLSRCESGIQAIELSDVNFIELLNGVRHSFEGPMKAKTLQLHYDVVPTPLLVTDRSMLLAILNNLFNNATEYTPTGGTVMCRVKPTDQGCELNLTNTNQTLLPDDLAHLFEPLWRKDMSRTGSSHCGLGLAITSRFCALLGFTLVASLPEPNLFQMTLVLSSSRVLPRKEVL